MTYLTILLYICVALYFFILELPVTNANCLNNSSQISDYSGSQELELVVKGYKFRLLLNPIVKLLSREFRPICFSQQHLKGLPYCTVSLECVTAVCFLCESSYDHFNCICLFSAKAGILSVFTNIQ